MEHVKTGPASVAGGVIYFIDVHKIYFRAGLGEAINKMEEW
jgi:hypothetical protein